MRPRVRHLCYAFLLAIPFRGIGQYCIPTTATPYAPTMPGLTLVQVNTINRASQDLEHYPDNNYTNTGLSTTLEKGQSYPMTLGFTIDAGISPHMNLRVWVDLNHDGELNDAGETLYSVDHVATTQTGAIVVPASATTGITRMRITAKMCSHGGHSLPTPCDQPPDILGYHGELEDYEVNIVDAVGIEESTSPFTGASLSPNPVTNATVISFTLDRSRQVRVDVIDAAGRVVRNLGPIAPLAPGKHAFALGERIAGLRPGTYAVRMVADGDITLLRFASTGE